MTKYIGILLLFFLSSWTDPPKKVQVYYFLSTTCKICQGYALEMREIYNVYSPQGVEFYALYPGELENDSTVLNFHSKYKLPFLGSKDSVLHYRWQATVTPEVFLIVNDTMVYHGRIDDSYVGVGKRRFKSQHHELKVNIGNVLENKEIITTFVQPVGCIIEK